MTDFLCSLPLFCLALTFGAFQVGLWCQKKTKSALCNPILIGAALVVGILLLTGIDPEMYAAGNAGLSWLLTPATVCLAVPLYRQLKTLKKNLPAILLGVVCGSLTSLAVISILCGLFALDKQLSVSLLPKSITAAMGIVLSGNFGGIESLTSVVILITGILGNAIGSSLCKLLHLTDPVSQGVAFGTASHIVGTSRASEISPLSGAVGGLSLVISGIFTALIFPIICSVL